MKIAILADIHSNVFALDAVLNDAKDQGIDLLLNLGDIFYGPIAPKATYDLLMEHDVVTIRGNQDRQIYEAACAGSQNNQTMQFVLEDMGQPPLNWLSTLPFDCMLSETVYMCHGTPTDDQTYLLENVQSSSPAIRDESEITDLLAGNDASLILCGHSHIPRTVQLKSDQLIVNPGSVGLPAYDDDAPAHTMETFCPHASYAIVEEKNSGWKVQQIKVPYDCKQAAAEALKRKRDDWAHFLTGGRGKFT